MGKGKARKIAALTTIIAVIAVAGTATAGEPIGTTFQGDREILVCKTKMFPWGKQCWSKKEGAKFSVWLRSRGADPKDFKDRFPQLAITFGKKWPQPPPTRWDALEHDFHKALSHAANHFSVSYDWLHGCAHQEGGHGRFVWNSQGSGAFGPFQFMSGTFESFSRSAFQVRGAPPMSFRRWDGVVGQTWTAAWAFANGYSYHWVAPAC